MIHIYVDAMGGDNAPKAIIEGSLIALRANKELKITLGGSAEIISNFIKDADDVKSRIEFDDCLEQISNHESPTMAIRQKKDSPIVKGMLKLRERTVDGFVSAGSTGAVLIGGMLRLGRINGIERPAIAPLIPTGNGQFLLVDAGANVDCRPEWLEQFALMGSIYMKNVRRIDNPKVGLANNGAEEEKGNSLTKESYNLLKNSKLNFVGNVEARDIPLGAADVIVCDGFVGNIILKYTEGIAKALLSVIKNELMSSFVSKIGALLAKPAFKKVKKLMDSDEVGGAPLLGLDGAVIKAHGSSNAYAFACAIKQCVSMVESDVVNTIAKNINKQ